MDVLQFEPWHWWTLAALLATLEILTPGIFLLWIGLAAAETGVLVYLLPDLDGRWVLLVFAVLSVGNAVAAWAITRRFPIQTDRPTLNKRGHQYIGRPFTLNEAIVNGHGVLRVDDTTWRVMGQDCPVGTRVVVQGVEGTALRVAVIDARA